jgi:peptidoglycan/xylan/chitin deacetylase (PgdA/CDA1 family)
MVRWKALMPFLLILFFLLLGAVSLWLNPEWVIARLRHTSPDVLYAVDVKEPYVALTIDDGPDKTTTPLILDILKAHQVKATFFLISDHIPGSEWVVARMVSEGHELGNHMTADQASIRLSLAEFEASLLQADEAISQFGQARWFRPGSGWYTESMLAVAREHGYRCALGSVYPFDPQTGSAWFSKQYVLWKVSPGDVIVLHDYQGRGRRTAQVLQEILPALISRGYHFVTISELSELRNQAEHGGSR